MVATFFSLVRVFILLSFDSCVIWSTKLLPICEELQLPLNFCSLVTTETSSLCNRILGGLISDLHRGLLQTFHLDLSDSENLLFPRASWLPDWVHSTVSAVLSCSDYSYFGNYLPSCLDLLIKCLPILLIQLARLIGSGFVCHPHAKFIGSSQVSCLNYIRYHLKFSCSVLLC